MQRVCILFFALTISVAAQVTTSQYNNFRTAATLNEKILTPANVNSKTFGKARRIQGGRPGLCAAAVSSQR